jgi:hypothetical protein
MRIRVSDVLDLFAAGLDAAQILDEMPDLETDDLKVREQWRPGKGGIGRRQKPTNAQ